MAFFPEGAAEVVKTSASAVASVRRRIGFMGLKSDGVRACVEDYLDCLNHAG